MRLGAGAARRRRGRSIGAPPTAPSVAFGDSSPAEAVEHLGSQILHRAAGEVDRAARRETEGAFRRRSAIVAAALALAACSGQPPLPTQPVMAGPQITVYATAAPLDPNEPARTRIGGFTYAGGLLLTSPDTSRLHGLSDLVVRPDGRLLAVSDDGDRFEARLVLDGAGRLTGVTDASLVPLAGEDGQPLSSRGKAGADAEGVALLADGAVLVSFERDHRILLYPPNGGPPRRAPHPRADFSGNAGMEALAADPARGPDAYIVGAEAGGRTWSCTLSAGCAESHRPALPGEAGLVAVTPLPDGGRAYLFRAFSLLKGVRSTLRIVDAQSATVDELKLAAPLTVDNFEGLAAAPRDDGSIRFYLLSDDNFSRLQRTLLLAFDWRPPTQARRTP